MNRRQFCRTMAALGSGAVLVPLLEACGQKVALEPTAMPPSVPTATSTATTVPTATAAPTATVQPTATTPSPDPTATASPTATPDPALAAVALIATADRVAGVRRAIELLGINPVRGRHVLLKPNFNSADEAPGSTHPDVLRTLLAALQDLGARSTMLVDRSGMGNTRQVMQRLGVFELADAFGCATTVLDELPEDAWQVVEGDGYHWQRGFPVPKLLLGSERVVQTCNLKTHRYGGHFTLSLKNSVGLVAKNHRSHNYMSELHGTDDQRRMIADINTAYAPALIVLDGVEAFVRGGPDQGARVAANVVLAGTDRVAMDAIGVAILRLFGTTPEVSRGKVFEQEQIARAVELGLGVASPDRIRLVTGDADSAAYAAKIMEVLHG